MASPKNRFAISPTDFRKTEEPTSVIKIDVNDDQSAPPSVIFSIGDKANSVEQSRRRDKKFDYGTSRFEEIDLRDFSRQSSSTVGSLYHEATVERVPHLDHYRLPLPTDTNAIVKRPTLVELHACDLDNRWNSATSFNEIASNGYEKLQDPDIETSKPLPQDKKQKSSAPAKLGWVQGVLMRCILNILGVMLYLRLSWVAGQAGIGLGSIVVLLSSVVTTVTALSMCAIATNGEVKGGGVYFLISRSLGPEFGGSIGVIFTLANAVGGAMYIVGFSETVRDLMKRSDVCIVDCGQNDIRIVSWATAFVILGIIIMGVSFETKAQIVLMIILIISLFSYFIGTVLPITNTQRARGVTGYSASTFIENFTPVWRGQGFFDVFGVYFPAATGIMAGANISGDLKDAQKDIPKGTLLAILLTTILYLACLWTTGATCLRDATGEIEDYYNGTLTDCVQRNNTKCEYGLLNYFQVMELESAVGPLVTAGIFAATLSSALASLVSAPKIFQALGRDHLYPFIEYFAKGYGKSDEPRRGYLLFFAVCMAVIALGDLNIIAPYISNFFLASYCLVNYACFYASFSESPGFRPSFRYYNMWLSLFGAALSIGVMFVINWITALVTFFFVVLLYVYILKRKPDVNWGSSAQAISYRSALQNMLKLQAVPDHVKTYRPQILLLSGNPAERPALVDFAASITKDISLLICGNVAKDSNDGTFLDNMQEISSQTMFWMKKRKLNAFYYPIVCPTLVEGCRALIQLSGMSRLKPDIALLGFKNDWHKCTGREIQEYFEIIHSAFEYQMGVGILRVRHGFNVINTLRALTMLSGDGNRFSDASGLTTPAMDNARRQNGQFEYNELSNQTSKSAPEIFLEFLRHGAQKTSTPVQKRLKEYVRKKAHGRNGAQALGPTETPIAAKKARLLTSMNQFRTRRKNAVIDVYWLSDDGGLTMLIPYLLTQPKSYLENAKLRVFTAASSKAAIDKEQLSMINLLRKFRINFADVTVISDIARKPHQSSIRDFRDLIGPVTSEKRQEEIANDPSLAGVYTSDDEVASLEAKTYRQLRIRESLLKYSRQSSLIVVTLPVPRKGGVSACLYLAWLETLTRGLPPVLLIRGNQESVLTFYS